LSHDDLAQFFRRLQVMMGAGIPVHRALGFLAPGEAPALRPVVEQLAVQVGQGNWLSHAFKSHPAVFPPIVVFLTRAGEQSGGLHKTLENLAGYLERHSRLRKKVQAAFVYPGLLALVTLFMVAFMVLWVFPKEQALFADLGTELPFLTRALMGLAGLATNGTAVALAVLVIGSLVVLWKGAARHHYRREIDRLVLRLPVAEKVGTARMLMGLSILLDSGATLPQTTVVASLAGNLELEERYRRFLQALTLGLRIGESLEKTGCFPGMVRQIIRVAEENGRLAEVLRKTALVFEEEVEDALEALTLLLEPLMLMVMGFTVGLVVLATFLPTLGLLQKL